MKEYVCLKDWTIDSGTYFEKGKVYKGKPYNDGKSVRMYGEVGMEINFHVGSEYFDIDTTDTIERGKRRMLDYLDE